MAAAAAFLRSVATKLARAHPPQLHARPPQERGLHGGAWSGAGASLTPPPTINPGASSFTRPPTTDKDLCRRLSIACTAAEIGAATITGTVVYLYFWVRPEVEEAQRKMSSGHGRGTSVEELAECIKDTGAKVEELAARQKDLRAALAKLKVAVESLRSKPEGERCS